MPNHFRTDHRRQSRAVRALCHPGALSVQNFENITSNGYVLSNLKIEHADQSKIGTVFKGITEPSLRMNRAGSVIGGSWCDPATWGGTVPTATSDITISNAVVLDCNAEVRSLAIAAGGKLSASRSSSSRLTLHGNLIVRGWLDYGTPMDRIAGLKRRSGQ